MITYVTPYYENAGMLREQLAALGSASEHILGAVEYIVVDDGSPDNPAAEVVKEFHKEGWLDGLDFKLFRILKDVRWNHIAARNIGVHYSTHQWLMLTDIDHVVPPDTFGHLLGTLNKLDKNTFYTFDRVDAPHRVPYKSHPHTWLMSRALWDKFGGYDERFSGHYGMDFLARERLLAIAQTKHLKYPIIRYPREVIADASTTRYERKLQADRDWVKTKRQQLKNEGTYEKPVTLSFEHVKVYPC